MSYSKENTRIEDAYRVYTDLFHTGHCEICGDEFHSRSKQSRYCSQRCKNDANIKRRKWIADQKRKQKATCSECGKPIEQDGLSKITIYCSRGCKQAAYRKRLADKAAIQAIESEKFLRWFEAERAAGREPGYTPPPDYLL